MVCGKASTVAACPSSTTGTVDIPHCLEEITFSTPEQVSDVERKFLEATLRERLAKTHVRLTMELHEEREEINDGVVEALIGGEGFVSFQ